MRRVSVLVCGEPMRGDDAVASRILAALPATTRSLVDVRDVSGLMPDDLLDPTGPVIVLDAVHGPVAGTVVDLPLDRLGGLVASGASPGSSHVLPMPMVLRIVEHLAGGLPEGRFIGVAGSSYVLGAPLSHPAHEAVAPAAARLGHWIRVLAHSRTAAQCA
jgi:hydrogenase maturation protease